MKSIRLLSILNFFALGVHILMSVATQFKWINKMDVGEVSRLFPTLFTPAGVTFAIWGVIYVTLAIMCVYHIIISFSKNERHEANAVVQKMGWWFIINNILTAAWLFVWTHQHIALAQILIVLQLISLVAIHGILGIQHPEHSLANKVFTQGPLSIYLGWISIATIANTAVFLTSIGWKGWGVDEALWTLFMIGAAVIITMLMIFFRNNIIFGLVVMWALRGIILNQQQIEGYHPSIIHACWIGIAFTGTAILIQAFRMQQYYPAHGETYKAEFSSEKYR